MKSKEYGSELNKLYPVVEPGLSDSGAVDCCLEFLVMAGGRSLPEVSFDLLIRVCILYSCSHTSLLKYIPKVNMYIALHLVTGSYLGGCEIYD